MSKEKELFILKHDPNMCNQASPVQEDVDRVVHYDEDGNEFITYVPVDYPKIQKSHGSWKDWSLNALLAAGVNPNIPIHTGNPTRLEGISTVSQFESIADEILGAENPNEEKF